MPVSPGSSPLQWESIQLSGGPSPRFGAISGVIGNYWIITHGKMELFRVLIVASLIRSCKII